MSVVATLALGAMIAALQVTPDRGDVALPVIVSGLWIIGLLGLVGLTLWVVRDLRARPASGEDLTQ